MPRPAVPAGHVGTKGSVRLGKGRLQVDGISGADLYRVIFDLSPEPSPPIQAARPGRRPARGPPVHIADPAERLAAVRAELTASRTAKRPGRAKP